MGGGAGSDIGTAIALLGSNNKPLSNQILMNAERPKFQGTAENYAASWHWVLGDFLDFLGFFSCSVWWTLRCPSVLFPRVWKRSKIALGVRGMTDLVT